MVEDLVVRHARADREQLGEARLADRLADRTHVDGPAVGRHREVAQHSELAVEDRAQQHGRRFDQSERREDLDRVAARAVEARRASVGPEVLRSLR